MRVSIIRIAYRRWERCEIGNWLAATAILPFTDVELAQCRLNLGMIDYADVAAARNIAVKNARTYGADVLIMCDDDMAPHRQFVPTALKHLQKCPASVIGSPACGPRPDRVVNVGYKDPTHGIVRIGRPLAAAKSGIEKVHCMGSGLIAVGMKALEMLKPPYFDREYSDAEKTLAVVTEDMFFTRNLTEAGGDVFCAWDCWSGHAKPEVIEKPDSPMSPLKMGGDA